VKVRICLRSGLSESASIPVKGDLTVEDDTLSVTWTDIPAEEEKSGCLNCLAYSRKDGVLTMLRSGEHSTDLSFNTAARTQGVLSTPHGDFVMEIETLRLAVPDELWPVPGKTDVSGFALSGKSILIRYLLHLSGQEPMQNDIEIQISLEKNEE